jgi:hypothetical protein
MDAHSANAFLRLNERGPGFLDHLRHALLFQLSVPHRSAI